MEKIRGAIQGYINRKMNSVKEMKKIGNIIYIRKRSKFIHEHLCFSFAIMKNILLGLFLLLSLQSLTQGNFRGMDWGSSLIQLKTKYPDVQWETAVDGEIRLYGTKDYVAGLEVTVGYGFIENKLEIGLYAFEEEHISDNMYYEDFISISNILKDKYDMELEEKWNNTTWKDSPNQIGHALASGHVEIVERFEDQYTAIIHRISGGSYGDIEHVLIYSNITYVNSMRAKKLEDF